MSAFTFKATIALGLFLALAACGGGGTSAEGTANMGGTPPDFSDPELPNTNFDALSSTASELIDAYVTENGTPATGLTRSTTVPTSGTASYTGFLYGVVDQSQWISDLTLDVDFANRTISGTAENFETSIDEEVSGLLTGDGDIVRDAATSQPQATLVLRGDLTVDGTDESGAIALDGDFYPDGTATNGAIAGLAEGNIGAEFFEDGVFGAEE